MAKIEFNEHFLVPKHEILSESEENSLLELYSIKKDDLPRIKLQDPALLNLKATSGNVIKITRNSKTGGLVNYYRLVE